MFEASHTYNSFSTHSELASRGLENIVGINDNPIAVHFTVEKFAGYC